MDNQSKAAMIWNLLYPRSNFYKTSIENQRKIIDLVEHIKKVVND